MLQFKLLEIKDLASIVSNLQVSPSDDIDNYFSPHFIREYYENELFLRVEIFKFTSFVFGIYDDYGILKSTIIIRDVPACSNLNSYEIISFTNCSDYFDNFNDLLNNNIKNVLDEYLRINIIIHSENTNLIERLHRIGFKKEWLMKCEFNDNDFLQMTYFIEDGVNNEN